ncbi:unnamed protein product [Timema podura]|uniref:Uncharacterized protein n=1 Tax=Timema podura TaxID=61482 RepID=A0ABN7NDG0_TIMPD|nr:unnamed protein product [Timema podura]
MEWASFAYETGPFHSISGLNRHRDTELQKQLFSVYGVMKCRHPSTSGLNLDSTTPGVCSYKYVRVTQVACHKAGRSSQPRASLLKSEPASNAIYG